MPDRLSLKYAAVAVLFAVCAGFSSPALAGFQWVAPSDVVAAPSMGAPQAPAPSFAPASAAPEVISPVVISGGGTPSPAAPPPDKASDKTTVLGFAKSVPLAVALRQILPSGYAFSIDQDVDMGTLVSFQGGRPWRDTLRDALAPVGLTMHEQGQMVTVSFAAHELTPPAAPQAGTEPKALAAVPAAPPPLVTAPVNVGLPSVEVADGWTAERGDNLRRVLENWSRRANVEFDWLSEYDYPLEASVAFSGSFESAVRSLLTGFEGAHPQPVAELHSNPNLGQMVLVVQTRGNTNSD